ncbi:MAG: helix-turn-helix transcriptional regulator [Rhodocyclaceae bacterium]|nr:helix-turn-helix transcriptional regulator [Rhodocyclaceae bacterium]
MRTPAAGPDIPDINTRFGAAVRRQRRQLGLSQEALAALADINRSYLGEVERGQVTPSLETIDKIARALRKPLAELLG